MRTVIIAFIAVAGLTGVAAPVQATPVAPHYGSVADPAITQVLHRCGKGYYRQNAWQDKQGAWHGKCVPKKPKKTSNPSQGA